MPRPAGLGLSVAAALAAAMAPAALGCGDNAVPCGVGTIEVDGRCTAPPITTCGEGTKPRNGECVLDPQICQAGTVLIADRCVDPSRGLTIDLEESAEPNALGIAPGVELSTAPAGAFALKPIGETFVVHGHLAPFRDVDGDGQLDPDVDTFVVTVAAPTLLAISVDGVGGVEAGFYVAADLPGAPAPRFERYGLPLTGDTTVRRIVLPAAGAYRLAIADTRSLAIGDHPPPPAGARGATGGPAAEYFAALTAEAIPAPTTIAITGGTGSLAGTLAPDEVRFFTAALGATTSSVRDAMPGAATAAIAVITDAGALVGYAEECPPGGARPPADAVARVSLGGTPAVPVIAVDAVYNYGPAPEPFTVTVTVP
jgi:hypothetical protein